jgi:hypothetical protein
MHKMYIKILYFDNWNITPSSLYTGVVMVYWHYLIYHLQLTKLHADAACLLVYHDGP